MLRDALVKVKEQMPVINHVIANGVAYSEGIYIENIIDSLMSIAFRHTGERRGDSLPDNFRYVTYEHVTPEAEYLERAKGVTASKYTKGKMKNALNMARTDTYLVKYIFENDGRTIEKYVAIPFIRRGGLITVNGVLFGIAPVLKSRGLSLTSKGYFVEFPRTKVAFEQLTEQFLVNGNIEHIYMPFTTNLHAAAKPSQSSVPAVANWLFAKYGLQGAFKLYIHEDIEVYDVDSPTLATIDTNVYAVCKPDPHAKGGRGQIAIVLPKASLTAQAKILIGSAFYIARRNVSDIVAEFVDDPTQWQAALGAAIFGRECSKQRRCDDMQLHFSNIERYIDERFRQELIMESVDCETIYDFLFYVITRITERTGGETTSMARLWGRYYTTNDYLLRDLREAIFKAHFQLVRSARKTQGAPLAFNEVTRILNSNIKRDIIHSVNSGHGEISPFMTASDNMLIGLTSHCIDQTDARKKSTGKKKVIDLTDPAKHLHSSIAEVGSLANLPKSSPIGFSRINPYVRMDRQCRIVQKKQFIDLMRVIDADIRMKGI